MRRLSFVDLLPIACCILGMLAIAALVSRDAPRRLTVAQKERLRGSQTGPTEDCKYRIAELDCRDSAGDVPSSCYKLAGTDQGTCEAKTSCGSCDGSAKTQHSFQTGELNLLNVSLKNPPETTTCGDHYTGKCEWFEAGKLCRCTMTNLNGECGVTKKLYGDTNCKVVTK